MNRLLILYSGEITRMKKYGITIASLGVALLWIIILHFIEITDISAIFPLLIFTDTTLMSIILIGASMLFEKQENIVKSISVLPIEKGEYILAKTLGTMTSSITTLLLLLLYGILVKGMEINILGIFGAVLLCSFVFAQLGVILTYNSKDFTTLLMGMFKFSIIFAIPTILEYIKVFSGDLIRYIQYINPTKNALVLLLSSTGQVERIDFWIAFTYLVVLGVLLYFAVRKGFENFAMKESGG